jgi:aspartate oxidase
VTSKLPNSLVAGSGAAGLTAALEAADRHESRGVRYRIDAPAIDPAMEGHLVLRPGQPLTLEHWT